VEITDRGGGSHNWSAGRETCTSKDHIGLFIKYWGRHTLVVGGFGPRFLGNAPDPKHWNIGPGDPIEFAVYAPGSNTPLVAVNTVAT
jgi:hypothetical protein